MKSSNGQKLGRLIKRRRETLGLSGRQLAEAIGARNSTVVRIESGESLPTTTTLTRLAEALELPTADVYAAAGYTVPGDLPSFQPYLRTKYGMRDEAVADLNRAFERV